MPLTRDESAAALERGRALLAEVVSALEDGALSRRERIQLAIRAGLFVVSVLVDAVD